MTDQANDDLRGGATDGDALLRLLVESSTDLAIIGVDRAGVVTAWNVGAQRLLGYAEQDILGRDGDIIFSPEDRAAGAPQWERSTAISEGRAEDERWHLRKDGSLFWGSGLLMPLADGSGFLKAMRNLTDRHVALERLKESEALFRVLATNIPQLVFRTTGQGVRTWGSPQWIAFTGVSFDDSLGFGWLDAVHPDDLAATMRGWEEAQSTGHYYVEHRIRRVSDGEYRWHQTRAQPVGTAGVESAEWVGTSSDVHELRGLQERQKVLLAELQHRTRNLLAIVQAIGRQTLRNSTTLPDFTTEFEGRLRALSRVQGLLSRSDHGPVDLRVLVDAELSAYADGSTANKVTLDGPPVLLPASSAQTMALAIHELATNAVKHGALKQPAGRLAVAWALEGGGTEERRLALDWRESGVELPPDAGVTMRKGYGRELIERALPYQLGAKSSFAMGEDGVRCQILLPMEAEAPANG